MREQRGIIVLFLLLFLVLAGGVLVTLFYPRWQKLRAEEERGRIFESVSELSGRMNRLLPIFEKSDVSLTSSDFTSSLESIADFKKFLETEKRKMVGGFGENDLRSGHLQILNDLEASVGGVLKRGDFLLGIREKFLKTKEEGEFLYKLSYAEGASGKEKIFQMADLAKKEVDFWEKNKVDGSFSFWKNSWVDLLRLRRNYLASLEEALKYNVSYQWVVAQYRYPTKEKEVFPKFEKETSGWLGDGKWMEEARGRIRKPKLGVRI